MAVRITMLAKDIAVATKVVDFALAADCALEEYVACESPLANKPKPNGKSKGSDTGVRQKRCSGYYIQGKNEFAKGSMRYEGFAKIQKMPKRKYQRIEINNYLVKQGYTKPQATAIIAGCIKTRNLLNADEA